MSLNYWRSTILCKFVSLSKITSFNHILLQISIQISGTFHYHFSTWEQLFWGLTSVQAQCYFLCNLWVKANHQGSEVSRSGWKGSTSWRKSQPEFQLLLEKERHMFQVPLPPSQTLAPVAARWPPNTELPRSPSAANWIQNCVSVDRWKCIRRIVGSMTASSHY